MEKALVALRAHQRSKAPFMDWLPQNKQVNQKNMVALPRCCCDIEPHASVQNCEINLEVLRFVARSKLDTKFPKCHDLMRKHWAATVDA